MSDHRRPLTKRAAAVLSRTILAGKQAAVDSVRDVSLLLRLTWSRRTVALRASAENPVGKQRILMVDDLVPDPLFGAGYPRAALIVRSILAMGHDVDFYPMASTQADLARVNAAFEGRVQFHNGEGARGLRRLLWRKGHDYDAFFVSRPDPMRALAKADWQPRKGHPRPPVVYDAEAVWSLRERRRRELYGPAWRDAEFEGALTKELRLARGADVVTAVSPSDVDLIAARIDLPVFTLSHAVTSRTAAPGLARRRDFLFVGRLSGRRSQSPNVDSILWFLADIMPKVDGLARRNHRLHIVGKVDSPDLEGLASDSVIFHGAVDDLRPFYDGCCLFLAPTRYASGIPLKIVEAMGEGIVCVATPLVARQLAANASVLPVADNPDDFARHLVRLSSDAIDWERYQRAGFDHVRTHFSRSAFDGALTQVFARVLAPSAK